MSGEEGKNDALNRSFIDPVFLQQFALTRENALEYFSRSPFYDPVSNNETLRMQGTSMSHLQGMTGVEFALDERAGKDGRLFLIRKQRRSGPSSVQVLSMYYILDGTVYQSPDLLHLLMTKYNKISSGLSAAFSIAAGCTDYSGTGMDGAKGIFAPLTMSEDTGGVEDKRGSGGRKRQKITDCRDFPSFSSCVGDMQSFLQTRACSSDKQLDAPAPLLS
mmetsp:Transcript_2460/g.4478  ORF Transcript_2460/g.4478 Transcript_2460/m.4478 type:complete len:219 (+) Transcript_2460:88-744(+)|eukprot:CAMPEP_0114472198 /NCGR_PEP_ID=MMETSP0104-20121206/12248_1 /TAXON_ID=37642 ORGANISM="Paraphysomonas imperforata, Strain PA2" /NCGR_SAMPLE_ID=MMETSP0104 /ASSEMBLY_ACC=CAM_ASM_000202 /LENGTH=218 /DNA_ID=CAMNT_0001646155 /DNA_START=24 /DNA_END=680 /DNA_ORIENTATION=-